MRGSLRGTPGVNTAFLALGAVLGSIVGTTGAAQGTTINGVTKIKVEITETKDGKEVWFDVHTSNEPSGMFITMVVVEKQAMQQEVTIDAQAMARAVRWGDAAYIEDRILRGRKIRQSLIDLKQA